MLLTSERPELNQEYENKLGTEMKQISKRYQLWAENIKLITVSLSNLQASMKQECESFKEYYAIKKHAQ